MATEDERRRRERHHHHPAVGDVMKLLSKANDELSAVHRCLEIEFQRLYPDRSNPCKVAARVKKIQDQLAAMKNQCRQLLADKQDLIDNASTLVGQRSSLQRLLTFSGLPQISDSDDTAYTNLDQVIDEWTGQVRANQSGREADEDVNRMLFSALVQNS